MIPRVVPELAGRDSRATLSCVRLCEQLRLDPGLQCVDYSTGEDAEIENAEHRDHECDRHTARYARRAPRHRTFTKEHHDDQPEVVISGDGSVEYANDDERVVFLIYSGAKGGLRALQSMTGSTSAVATGWTAAPRGAPPVLTAEGARRRRWTRSTG